jgi:hypothetical protein
MRKSATWICPSSLLGNGKCKARKKTLGVKGLKRNGKLSVRIVPYAARARKASSGGNPAGRSEAGNTRVPG